MKRICIILASFMVVTVSGHGEAIRGLSIEDLSIQIMPEHDLPSRWQSNTPAVLVGYYGALVNESDDTFADPIVMTLPVNELEFVINMVCETERGMICKPYEIDATSSTITWHLSRAMEPGDRMPFMVEYYSSPFDSSDPKRFRIEPAMSGDTTATVVDVVEPARASEFAVVPAPERTFTRDDGFVAHRISFADAGAMASADVSVSYLKADNRPSVSADSTPPGAPGGSPRRQGLSSEAIYGVGLLIAASLGVLGVLTVSRLMARSAGSRGTRDRSANHRKALPARGSAAKHRETDRRKARQLLLDGKISESTYKQITKDISRRPT